MAGKWVCEWGSARPYGCGRGFSYCSDCINVVWDIIWNNAWVSDGRTGEWPAHQGRKSAVLGPAVSTETRLFPPTSASVCQSASAGFLPFCPQPPPSHLHAPLRSPVVCLAPLSSTAGTRHWVALAQCTQGGVIASCCSTSVLSVQIITNMIIIHFVETCHYVIIESI